MNERVCHAGFSFNPVKNYLFMPKPYFEHLTFCFVTFFYNHWKIYSNSTNVFKSLNKKLFNDI